jgi:hypothetical protein
MKVITFAFLATAVSAGILVAQSNPENQKFTIVISADKPEVPLGSNIVVSIKTTNISDELIPMEFGGYRNMPDGFHYDIRDEQGAKLAKTVYNDIRPSKPSGSTRSGQLAPGKSKEDISMISDDYPFDRPGKYTIRVWMPATKGTFEKPESGRVYSNTISITVVGPEAPVTAPQ